MGFMSSDPVLYSHSPAAEIQRQVVKTKILERTESSSNPKENEELKAKANRTEKAQRSKSEETAQKAHENSIDRAAAMRHLKYEVIEDANIVQVSVVNSEDGTVIRKVPPDKMVGFVKNFREKASGKKKTKLDIQA